MARVGFSSLNVNQMAGNKGMIAVCLRSRQQERSRNGPLDLVETHNNQQLQRQQRAVPLELLPSAWRPLLIDSLIVIIGKLATIGAIWKLACANLTWAPSGGQFV